MQRKIFQVTYTDEDESKLHAVIIAGDIKESIAIFIAAIGLHIRTKIESFMLGTAKAGSKPCVVCIDESDY